jgi:hypothetical protein
MGTAAIDAFLMKSWGRRVPGRESISVLARRRLDPEAVIDIEVAGRGWRLAVENKIYSGESDGQTEKYARYYEALKRAGEKVFLVFLTLDGRPAKAKRQFRSMSYCALREALETLKPTTECGRFWLEQFCSHICCDLEIHR